MTNEERWYYGRFQSSQWTSKGSILYLKRPCRKAPHILYIPMAKTKKELSTYIDENNILFAR